MGWHWVTGEEWANVPWAPGEPNDIRWGEPDTENSQENYLCTAPGGFNDHYNGNMGGYLIEYEMRAYEKPTVEIVPEPPIPNSVPEPASMLLFGLGGLAMTLVRRKKKTI